MAPAEACVMWGCMHRGEGSPLLGLSRSQIACFFPFLLVYVPVTFLCVVNTRWATESPVEENVVLLIIITREQCIIKTVRNFLSHKVIEYGPGVFGLA